MKLLIITIASAIGLFTVGNKLTEEKKDQVQEIKVAHSYCDEGEDEDPQPILSGRISDNTVAQNPIHHACVELRTTGGTFYGIIGSDANGHYYFNSVPNGTYNMTVTASGYTTQIVGVTVSGTPQSVNVQLP